jgi:hypothetical protein
MRKGKTVMSGSGQGKRVRREVKEEEEGVGRRGRVSIGKVRW